MCNTFTVTQQMSSFPFLYQDPIEWGFLILHIHIRADPSDRGPIGGIIDRQWDISSKKMRKLIIIDKNRNALDNSKNQNSSQPESFESKGVQFELPKDELNAL